MKACQDNGYGSITKPCVVVINWDKNKEGETEVGYDFVFRREASLWEPPRAQIEV